MRLISGIVKDDGKIDNGSGDFDVRKESTGVYTITLRPPFNKSVK